MTRLNSDQAFEGASRGEVAPEMEAKMGDKGPCARFVHDSLRPDSANGIGVFAPDLPTVDGGEPESESWCPEPLEYNDEKDEGDEVIDLPIALQHSKITQKKGRVSNSLSFLHRRVISARIDASLS